MVAIGILPAIAVGGGIASALGSIFGGRGDDKRARGYEREALKGGREAMGRAGERYGPNSRMSQYAKALGPRMRPGFGMKQASVGAWRMGRAFADQTRPEFERGLEESVGDVVGGLGRRGGLVGETVGRAGERYATSVANYSAAQIPQLMNQIQGQTGDLMQAWQIEEMLARADENTYLSMLGQFADTAQGSANATRRGYSDMAGGLMTAGMFL